LCVRTRVCSLSLLSLSSRILTQEVAAGGFRRVFGPLRAAELQLVWLGWASGARIGKLPTESPASSTLLRSPAPLPRHTTAGAAVLRAPAGDQAARLHGEGEARVRQQLAVVDAPPSELAFGAALEGCGGSVGLCVGVGVYARSPP
jgi:hypothetical protein